MPRVVETPMSEVRAEEWKSHAVAARHGATTRSIRTQIELVRSVQCGDTQAFGELYKRHRNDIRRYLNRMLGDSEIAEDITSETFLRAFCSIDRFNHHGSGLLAWLTTIARHVAIDFLRAARKREVCLDPLPEPAATSAVDNEVIRTFGAAHVRRGVGRLPASQRECVQLRFLQGKTVGETADAMGRSSAAVRQLQQRAVRNLANRIDPEWLQQ